MADSSKMKLSLTLSADLVALVDHEARATGGTRSVVIDAWLRRAAVAEGLRVESARVLHDATVRYYQTRSAADVADDDAWVSAASMGSLPVESQ